MILNRHISDANLSAYVDGEAGRPESLRRHLQRCEECASRHMRLAKLSAHVQALPELAPAIGRARMPLGMSAVAVAAVVLVAAFVSVDRVTVQPVLVAEVAAAPSEAQLMEELERRVAGGAVVEPWLASSTTELNSVPEVVSVQVLAALAHPEVAASLEAEMTVPPDYRSELRALDQDTAVVFRELLSAYARDELLGQYAKEG